MARLKDREVLSICEAEIDDAQGYQGGDLANERTKAMDYYHGRMEHYISVEEDRSAVVARDVLNTVEWILPSLMKILMETDNAIVFTPVGPEDEEAAAQETDVVRHVFYEQNEGFINLYSFCKDALLSKTGITKTWWEEDTWQKETYKGLTQLEVVKLLNKPGFEYEIIDGEEVEGLINLTLKCKRKNGKVCVEPTPPEEFGISRVTMSPNPKKARFVFHRVQKRASELIEMGFDRKKVESLPYDNYVDTQERLARRHLSDEKTGYGNGVGAATHKSLREIWITECYIYLDRDDDGVAELLKVTLANSSGYGGSGSTLLDIEEVDSIPFSSWSPVVETHKFYGLSIADLVMDIQEIRTVLFRGMLDNMYLANNARTAVSDKVNLDDLLVSRPGGVVRVDTEDGSTPSEHVMQLDHRPIPQQTFGLLELLDSMIKSRTGVGDEVMGLDAKALQDINTGVILHAYEAARMRIEMIARIVAELGMKNIFKDIHECLCKNQDKAMVVRLRNKWVQVDPSEWRTRENMKVNVGIGNATKERKQFAIEDILQTQISLMESPAATLVSPQNLYNSLVEKAGSHDLEPTKFFTDPQTLPPPQPPPPDPQMILAGAQAEALQTQSQTQAQKVQADYQVDMANAQNKRRELELKIADSQADNQTDAQKLAMEKYKADLNAEVSVALKQLEYGYKAELDGLKKVNDDLAAEVKTLSEKMADSGASEQ